MISVACLGLWISVVEPFPDRDSVHQLFIPYLNALKLSGWISSDPLFLKSAFLDTYPWGISFLPALLGVTGLWEAAFQYLASTRNMFNSHRYCCLNTKP